LEDIEVTTPSGVMPAYLARAAPGSPKRPPVVLLHEAFGLNDHIRSIADRLAWLGHDAIAPHLYYRRTREPAAYDDVPLAVELASELSIPDIVADFDAAAARVTNGDESVIALGYCFGGAVAYIAAALSARVERAVAYYPVSILNYWDRAGAPRAPLLVYFGDDDEFLGPDERNWLAGLHRDRSVKMRTRIFPGAGHAFFNDARPDLYHDDSALESWAETLRFFDQGLTTRGKSPAAD